MYDDAEQIDEGARRLEELRSRIDSQINLSGTYLDSELSQFRERASNLYYGRPYGDEQAGYSQVVSRDVLEVIEWITAQLLRIFTGERFCEFDPFGPEDVEACEQQTDYVNHVLMRDCNGAILFYDWFKDALMHRFGVVHWGYCDYYEPVTETYTGLSDEQLQAVLMDGDLAEHTPRQEQMPDGMTVQLHDVRIRRVKRDRKLKVEAIPPEEFLIDRNARALDEAQFVGHKTRRTASDLRKEGVPDTLIERLGSDEDLNDSEAQARNVDATSDNSDTSDERLYWLYTCYLRHDLDGDGFDELLRVRYVGGEIVELEPALEIPYADICPVRTPHRFLGLSYTDVVEDIQRIKTVLWRQALDNLYLTNKPQREAVEGQVNLTDLQTAAVGGVIRTKQPGMVRDLQVPTALGPTLEMVQYIDNVREERTGTSAASQGRDADQIHDTAGGMAMMVSQAQMRVELVARLFAEGGVKRLFVGLYNAIVRNQDAPRMVRLRGKFVPIDPREWRERNNATVTVGLGVGTKEAQLKTLQSIATMQMDLLGKGIPLVTPDKLKYTLSKLVEAAGLNPASVLAEPEDIPPPQPPPPSEALQIAQIQAQIEAQKRQVEVMKAQQDAQLRAAQINADKALKLAQMQAAEREKEREHQIKLASLKQDDTHFYDKLFHDATLAREKSTSSESARQQAEADEEQMTETRGHDDGSD